MPKPKTHKNDQPTLISTVNDDVDLIRFEKNLLQFGFFGATDPKVAKSATRSFEMFVNRNNHRVKVAVEFIGSEKYGLPTTTDRDKFFAFLKIAEEQRAREGKLNNPIRFSGYRLIKELGLERQGDIYADILSWGERMTVTSIASRNIVFLAAKKIYNDDVLHVFSKFRRTAIVNEGGKRQEVYEVFLADWLLENLNQRWVVLEDVNAYKQLTRPISKGIFSQLHLWYYASEGESSFEKDYRELCTLLAVTEYPYLSRIKQTMGPALDELVKIQYLLKWDIQKMKTKIGYKVVMWPGQALQAFVKKDGRVDKRQADKQVQDSQDFNELQNDALQALFSHGVTAETSKTLVVQHGHEKVIAMVEYVESLISTGRTKIDNPAGLIVSFFKNDFEIPSSFITTQRMKESLEQRRQADEEKKRQISLELEYMLWVEKAIDDELVSRFSQQELEFRIREAYNSYAKTDPIPAKRLPPGKARDNVGRSILRKEIRQDLEIPSLEDWIAGKTAQIDLFE